MSLYQRPPQIVLDAFGVGESDPTPLGGGQGLACIANDVVLKPIEDAEEATWIAEVLNNVIEDGFRVSRPVLSSNGTWVVNGWSAWHRIDGEHRLGSGHWSDAVAVCRRFHAAIADVSRPAFFDTVDNVFRRAHRMAFDQAEVTEMPPAVLEVADELKALVEPITLKPQVVHGDFAGNVLHAPGQPPGIIDFSPYWAPAEFAVAQTLVDAVLWYERNVKLLDLLGDGSDSRQLIVRATRFRLYVAGMHHGPASTEPYNDARNARPIVAWLNHAR